MFKIMIFFLLIHQHTSSQSGQPDKSAHYLAKDYLWLSLSGLGLVGSALNIFLLHTFYRERKAMATSVNAMICFNTLHRMIYATVSIHWRTYNMLQDEPLFTGIFGRYQVVCRHTKIIWYWMVEWYWTEIKIAFDFRFLSEKQPKSTLESVL